MWIVTFNLISLITCFSLVATLLSYLGIPGSLPQKNKFKKMDNVHMFSSFLFHERRANGAPFFFSARPFFNWNFPRPCSVFCFVSFSYVRNKRRNEIWVLSCLWHLLFFFEWASPIMSKFCLERPYLKKRSLMIRP